MIQKSAFIALVGPTNAGKSTLINALTGAKISIVSRKVQTTRARVLGVVMHDDQAPQAGADDLDELSRAQLVFIDTPGLFQPQKMLDRAMIHAAETAMNESDMVVCLLDVSKPKEKFEQDVREVLERVSKMSSHKQVAVALNKIDKIPRERLLEYASIVQVAELVGDVFMISALNEDGIDALLQYCHRRAVQEPWPFPEDQISTMPFRLMTAEITREAAMDLLHKEIPYDLTVYTEDVEHFDNGDLRVSQIILVEKNSQKTIVLGKGGQKIKAIGAQARKEMSEVFDQKIHLSLLVKVKPNWKADPEYYRLWNLQQ